MKKLVIVAIACILLSSCSYRIEKPVAVTPDSKYSVIWIDASNTLTSTDSDIKFIQDMFPNSTIYRRDTIYIIINEKKDPK